MNASWHWCCCLPEGIRKVVMLRHVVYRNSEGGIMWDIGPSYKAQDTRAETYFTEILQPHSADIELAFANLTSYVVYPSNLDASGQTMSPIGSTTYHSIPSSVLSDADVIVLCNIAGTTSSDYYLPWYATNDHYTEDYSSVLAGSNFVDSFLADWMGPGKVIVVYTPVYNDAGLKTEIDTFLEMIGASTRCANPSPYYDASTTRTRITEVNNLSAWMDGVAGLWNGYSRPLENWQSADAMGLATIYQTVPSGPNQYIVLEELPSGATLISICAYLFRSEYSLTYDTTGIYNTKFAYNLCSIIP